MEEKKVLETYIHPINTVWDITNKLMEDPKYLYINTDMLPVIAERMQQEFLDKDRPLMGYPDCIKVHPGKSWVFEMVAYELIAGAVNYQYWYAKCDIRPNCAGATLMYQLLDESFEEADGDYRSSKEKCLVAIDTFKKKLSLYRFPNLEQRLKHLTEVYDMLNKNYNMVGYIRDDINCGKEDLTNVIHHMITNLPGYAEDIFMKRIFLVIMMLNRRQGWFKKDIAQVPIPADYQIPKMLRWLGCIKYHAQLRVIIAEDELIPAGSRMEGEIRAASIFTCRLLAELAGCTMCDVDDYLWLNRKDCSDRFHLTVTTNY